MIDGVKEIKLLFLALSNEINEAITIRKDFERRVLP